VRAPNANSFAERFGWSAVIAWVACSTSTAGLPDEGDAGGGNGTPDLGVQAWTPQRTAGTPVPVETPALAVPSQYGGRPDQEGLASPVPVETAGEEQEELVTGAEAGPASGAEGDLELLAQEQVLEKEALAAAEEAGQGGQEEPEEFDHPGRIADRSTT
jgi:hypothetical protein